MLHIHIYVLDVRCACVHIMFNCSIIVARIYKYNLNRCLNSTQLFCTQEAGGAVAFENNNNGYGLHNNIFLKHPLLQHMAHLHIELNLEISMLQ